MGSVAMLLPVAMLLLLAAFDSLLGLTGKLYLAHPSMPPHGGRGSEPSISKHPSRPSPRRMSARS